MTVGFLALHKTPTDPEAFHRHYHAVHTPPGHPAAGTAPAHTQPRHHGHTQRPALLPGRPTGTRHHGRPTSRAHLTQRPHHHHRHASRGLRLHLVCTLQGVPIAFALTGAKADERETLLDFGRDFEHQLAELDLRLLRPRG